MKLFFLSSHSQILTVKHLVSFSFTLERNNRIKQNNEGEKCKPVLQKRQHVAGSGPERTAQSPSPPQDRASLVPARKSGAAVSKPPKEPRRKPLTYYMKNVKKQK